MLRIGESRVVRADGRARLCADVVSGRRRTTLWFAVDEAQADCLSAGRADPFAMALLPAAMRAGRDIACESPISERLRDQLNGALIPALASTGGMYRGMRVIAPLTAAPIPNRGAVGTGFSGGVDSLYTVMTHGPGSEFPLTHLAVFNSGVFEGEGHREEFRIACDAAAAFARERGLRTVFVDTNFVEALPERFLDVYSFRNLACALALQGLFGTYLLSSGHDAANFAIDIHNSARYDLMTVPCAATEGLRFHLSGVEVARWQKLDSLRSWRPSHRWLHPCVYGHAGEKNCGHCKKCARDMTTLYALGALDAYAEVFDLARYRREIAARVGFVLANRGDHLFDETLALLDARGVAIPRSAHALAAQFRRAMARLSEGSEGGEP